MKRTASIAMAVLLALACNKESAPEHSAPPAQPVEPAVLTDAVIDQTAVAVKEDFEDEAFETINEDTLDAQVDALEKEILSDE